MGDDQWDDSLWDDKLDIVAPQTSSNLSSNTECSWRDERYRAESNTGSTRTYYGNSNSDAQYTSSQNNFQSFRGRGRGRRMDNRSRQAQNQPDEFSEMFVDNCYVGKIIGRGGCKIQEFQRDSGANIKVLRNDTGSADTTIRISGTSEAREKAKGMIENIMNEDYRSVSKPVSTTCFQSVSTKPTVSTESTDSICFDWDRLHLESDKAREKYLASLPPIVKDFYKEDPAVAAMTKKEVGIFRSQNNSISVMKVDPKDNRDIPNPVTSFKQAFQHYPELLEELNKQGFTTPSPIQCQAWPIIMKGYDLIGIAQTGTGKTIAFLFPALIHLMGQVIPREKRVGPCVLIFAPTRELAQQIEIEAKKYTYHGIKSICIYGGGNRREQIKNVKGVDIVIATPGRLNDLVMNNVIDVSGVTYLVLDEADRMLDLGFEPQIRKVVIDIRPDRQTIMTSATWTSEIQELAERYMIMPMKVNVGALDLAAVHTVTQEIIFANDDYDERRQLLHEFIESMGPDDKAIVFVERKSIADDISSDLILGGIQVQSIHGDREQYDREQALDDLKTGTVKILIATDVASRGLDIKDITLILNLYFPHNIEEYVHRVGRTGRAGRTGKAISVFTRKDWMHADGLIKILEEADQFVPNELQEMAGRYKAWKQKKTAEDLAARGGQGRNRYKRY